MWYYNKAVARGAKKQEKNGCGSGPEGIQRHGNALKFLEDRKRIRKIKIKKFEKSFKKLLTNLKRRDIIIKSLNESFSKKKRKRSAQRTLKIKQH